MAMRQHFPPEPKTYYGGKNDDGPVQDPLPKEGAMANLDETETEDGNGGNDNKFTDESSKKESALRERGVAGSEGGGDEPVVGRTDRADGDGNLSGEKVSTKEAIIPQMAAGGVSSAPAVCLQPPRRRLRRQHHHNFTSRMASTGRRKKRQGSWTKMQKPLRQWQQRM